MEQEEYLKQIPSVDEILRYPHIQSMLKCYPRTLVVKGIREATGELRKRINGCLNDPSGTKPDFPAKYELEQEIEKKVMQKKKMGLKKAINATGIILHTGLGRAVLAKEAVEALSGLTGYCTLQADIETGKRSPRDRHVEKLLNEITGAESATVVNNNAAATMLILNTFAKGKEAIVSRGQLIEIGGSFRLPDVMEASGAVLKEVGTTNRTHLADYEKAISERTGLILHVHTSNYQVKGFTSKVSVEKLAELGKKYHVPVVDDIGAGALVKMLPMCSKESSKTFMPEEEPTVQESLKAGADVVAFSSDKLIGGPQGGIILGKKEFIERIRKNPMSRALRTGKLTLTALEATLRLFLDEEKLPDSIPTFKMLARSVESLEAAAGSLVDKIKAPALQAGFVVEIKDDFSQMGSGSLPNENIPTKVLSFKSEKVSAEEFARSLRKGKTPVFARIKDDSVIMDLRTVLDGEEDEIAGVLGAIFADEKQC